MEWIWLEEGGGTRVYVYALLPVAAELATNDTDETLCGGTPGSMTVPKVL